MSKSGTGSSAKSALSFGRRQLLRDRRNATLSAFLLAVALVPLLQAVPARAATKVWVSNAGVDSPTCGALSSPCATFQRAHDNVTSGGDVGVLNPGDYGTVVIARSVSIT